MKLRIKPQKRYHATIKFDKKIAKSFSKTAYYKVTAEEIKNLPNKQKEKKKYSTSRKQRVTKLIELYKQKLNDKSNKVWSVLLGIYRKNQEAARNGKSANNQDLISLMSSVPMLMTAYKTIRKNKGAMTLAAQLSTERSNKLTVEQKAFLAKTAKSPDGITREIFEWTSKLLRKGQYPWGASKRIYIDKPGQPGKKRPITIPPFMDRVIQESIRFILECIYEPYFEKRNRSFGFRPAKGAHDCIYCLTRSSNNGFITAIEGDIKSAYDKVCREKLIEILGNKIQDRQFLELIKTRLNYEYCDTQFDKYVREDIGIPQGGIDSPYLWNIYMMEFDEYVHSYIQGLLDSLNAKVRGKLSPNTFPNAKESSKVKWQIGKKIEAIAKIRKDLRKGKFTTEKQAARLSMFKLMQEVRVYRHKRRNLPPQDPNRRLLRFTYTRYADDWIVMGNFSTMLARKIQKEISTWLWETLKATLAEDKTLITDLRKEPAHFLGFELKAKTTRKLGYAMCSIRCGKAPSYTYRMKNVLKRTAGQQIYALPDRIRLINRLHMKGYCDKKGFPREIPWLSTLDSFTIIERFNTVMRGLANYYAEHISRSRGLYRWLYIVRFSCLKTLAQKYRTSINGIFKKFKSPGRKTIQVEVVHDFGKRKYQKIWRLLTETEAIQSASSIGVRDRIIERFEKTEQGLNWDGGVSYQLSRGATPRVIHDNFLDKIKWVNLRTAAALDLPCFICGSQYNVEMHHINHVRKRKFSQIPEKNFWEKIMALRNRRQIPVCSCCHRTVIHKGEYQGDSLKDGTLNLKQTLKGYDNRLAHLESFIKPGKEYFAKTLTEKGWKAI
jgi:retron-type reverse transcriptase